MDWPWRSRRIDTGMSVEAQTEGVMKVSDIVVPVMLVDNTAPTHAISDGPRARPLAINADDGLNVDEAHAAAIEDSNTKALFYMRALAARPTVTGTVPGTGATATAMQNKMKGIDIQLAGGVLGNVELVPALAGFFGVIEPCAVWSDSVGVYSFNFQDEDDVDCVPQILAAVAVEVKGSAEIAPFSTTHGAAGDNSGSPVSNVVFHVLADNKALEVDVAGGGGNEKIVLWYNYWYET